MKRRRNKLVLWEWTPDGEHQKPRHRPSRKQASLGAQALGAAALLAFLIFVLSRIPDTKPGYHRGNLARFMCETVGTDPDSAGCLGVAMGGWLLVVVAVGILLKIGRAALRGVGMKRDDPD